MALTHQQRDAIFRGLAPTIGEEPTDAMLAHFPTREADEPVTRQHLDRRLAEHGAQLRDEMADLRTDLRDEMADLRIDLRTEMADLRTDLRTEMAELRGDVRTEMAGLRSDLGDEMAGLRIDVRTDLSALETRLTYRMATLVISAVGLAFLALRFALPA